MKFVSFACSLVYIFLLPAVVDAQVPDAPANSKLPPLNFVKWAGAPVSYEQLRGKTVAVLVYATWCPKCNEWSGELFKQIKESVGSKPVVVLAINTDGSPAGLKQYLGQRGFFAPNILHGHDPIFHKRMGLESNLFYCLMIDPEGNASGIEKAGVFYTLPEGKVFKLARTLKSLREPGSFKIITDDMAPEIRNALWPCELGSITESTIRSACRSLSKENQEIVNKAVGERLEKQLELVKAGYKGTVDQKFEAYDTATQLARYFPGSEQGKKCKKVTRFMDMEETFKKELAARKLYQKATSNASNERRLRAALRSIATRFPGTLFGDRAQKEFDEASKGT